MIGALDRPSGGEILVGGERVADLDGAAYRGSVVGFVFQFHNLIPTLTALENVQLPMFGHAARRERVARARRGLEEVGLSHRASAYPPTLSGGERQRVAIARALVNRPSLLMCDEPTGNLDTATTVELTDLLESLHRGGATLVVITHNPVVAGRAQRQIAIRDGELTGIPSATTAPQTRAPDPQPASGVPEPPPDPGPPPTLPDRLPPADHAPGGLDALGFPDE